MALEPKVTHLSRTESVSSQESTKSTGNAQKETKDTAGARAKLSVVGNKDEISTEKSWKKGGENDRTSISKDNVDSLREKLLDPSKKTDEHTARIDGSRAPTPAESKAFFEHIKEKIAAQYESGYKAEGTSVALSKDIESLGPSDVIKLLEAIRDNPDLKEASLALCRKSALFDKLVLMKGEGDNPWVLRLHTYQVQDQTQGARDNLGEPIKDSEANTHLHRWQLTSRFVTGGFTNGQYKISDTEGTNEESNGEVLTQYDIVATKDSDGKARKPEATGEKLVERTANELYRGGDLVHYPVETAHSVNTGGAPLLGVTMTLAHTGEGLHDKSTFFQKELTGVVAQLSYGEAEHTAAVNEAIARLKLVELTAELAAMGPEFERFGHPNSLETEVMPTIAMRILEDNLNETSVPSEKMDEVSSKLIEAIDRKIAEIHPDALNSLIIQSQEGLIRQDFVKTVDELENADAKESIIDRQTMMPRDVIKERDDKE